MFRQIVTYIRSRTRSEWKQIGYELITLIREWFSLHGEVAALIGLFAGMALVLFFKVLLVFAVAISLFLFALYSIADE